MQFSTLFDGLSFTAASLPHEKTDLSLVTSRSGEIVPSSVFVCLTGLHTDGHSRIPEAVSRGASVIVGSRPYEEVKPLIGDAPVFYLTVENPRAALAGLCHTFRGSPGNRLKLIAVTGTNGKTSVVSMLHAIYSRAGIASVPLGTLSGTMTTPDPEELYLTLQKLADQGTGLVIMEASSHALALDKLAPLRPAYGIFTNLSPEHLDFHGTMSSYLAAKAKLFRQCKTGFIPIDDPYAPALIASASCRIITTSHSGGNADFFAEDVRLLGTGGIRYHLMSENRALTIRCPIPGSFTVSNTLSAAACALYDGIPPEIVRHGLCAMRGVPGRLERVPIGRDDFSVYIDFAHTPDALENVLRTVRGFLGPDSRLTVLFGCGGDRDASKRPVMGAIASRLADFVIVTSDNSRSEDPKAILSQILKGIDKELPHIVIENRRDAIIYAIENARRGDCILLAGKGHETYEIDRAGSHPFSEKALVLEAVSRLPPQDRSEEAASPFSPKG